MQAERPDAEDTAADRVYSAPASAQAEAARLLSDPGSTPLEKADALWTLGRGAYYSNRMSDAVVYLREALPLIVEPAMRIDVVLTLAPALSKEGYADQALELLDPDQAGLTPKQQGLLHNQRGIVLTELGRLPEAKVDLALAQQRLNDAGDSAGEARTLVNLGAAASMMGDQDEAERWYERGWELATTTGQDVVAAGIEGNLGYVASRRGDFATALDWYERARRSFTALGDVDLLVAVLETDHATTLLDVGLDADAAEAAQYAVDSSRAGGNRMLEVQALALLGEAQLRLDRRRDAETNLRRARDSANELGIRPWAMRAEYLRLRLSPLLDDGAADDFTRDVEQLAKEVLEAGWAREALRATQVAAQALLRVGESTAASALLDWADTSIDVDLADRIDVEFSRALAAQISEDRTAQRDAIEAGLAEIDRQRRLLGSAELQVRLGHRARAFRDLAVATAIADGDPAAVLRASEASRGWISRRVVSSTPPEIEALLSDLRDLRVGRSEAQLAGEVPSELDGRIRSIESEIIRRHRRESSEGELPEERRSVPAMQVLESSAGTTFVCYVRADDRLWAVRAVGHDVALFELGEAEVIESAVRIQRVALKGMANAGDSPSDADSARVDAANEELDRLLLAPLGVQRSMPLVIVPARVVSGLAWAGLPSLVDAAVTVAPSVGAWADGPTELVVRSAAFLGGPGLEQADAELDELGQLWGADLATAHHSATTAEASTALRSNDAVHIAAHGSFRSDNPWFSSIEFADGPLTVLDLQRLPSLPDVVMLASCDGAAAAGGEGSEVVGTTSTMLGLGVSAVIAPTASVNDAAARRFSTDLHRCLLDGVPLANAVREARSRAMARDTPGDRSAAMSFQVHGNRAASLSLSF